MRLSAPATPPRLIRLLLCLALLTQSLLPTPAGASGRGTGKVVPPAGRTAGRQDANLPDLNEARRRPRHEPKAVPPVPSTRRRCPPRNPRCNDGGTAAPQVTPTPAPTPGHPGRGGPFSVTSAAAPSFAVLPGGGRPWMDLSFLDFYAGGGYAVSDSPVRLLPPADFAAAPAPEPAAPYQSQGRVNVALAANGGSAGASSTFNQPPDWVYSAAGAIDGNRRGSSLGAGQWAGWNDDAPGDTFPDWLQVDFSGHKTIDEIDLFTQQDNYANPAEPTESMTFTQYGLSGFTVEYRTGTGWAAVPGGSVTGNNKVWRKFTFPAVTTDAIRVLTGASADGYSRITELEAWGASARFNLALAANGGVASASSSFNSPPWVFTPAGANDGDRKGLNWGSGGGWNDDAPGNTFPDWLQIDFPGPRAIDEVDVFTGQDAYASPSEPTEAMTFAQYGLTEYKVQYWTGTAWETVPGGSVSGNDKVWRKFTFPALTTSRIRVLTQASVDGYSRLAEVEAYEAGASQAPPGTGLTGEYYDGADFGVYRLTRPDASVNFDWAGGSPHSSVGADNFSARWTGTVVPRYTEDYTFSATTDDGVRLWIDGRLIINRWIDQAPYEEESDPIALEAGRHYAVRMEYYERGGGALAWLKWSSASQAKEIVPQARLYGCWKGADQFTKDFYQGALGRQPSAAELQDWAGRLNRAQGDYQLVAEAQGLGAQLFTSAAYAGLSPTDSEYVSDLYRAYLQRAPDAAGLSGWANHIAQCGPDQSCRAQRRAEVRAAFDQSLEFGEKVRSLCGTAAASPVNGGTGYNFSTARLDPSNRTGGGGADAYSRNYNFSIPLVSLPGRAGLDLGLALSYNSLVWTKDLTGVTFDADEGFPSPGFRLGFPTVEPKFVNPQLQQAGQPVRHSYLLVTPSGARVELRQVGTSSVYESADSSYLQLSEVEMTLSSADGTRLSFVLLNGAYRCHQLKDRHGNYLTVSYYGDGRLWQVTDTLGRVVTFNYDNYQNLTSITQPWTREGEPGVSPAPAPDEAHEWTTFGYENRTLQPQFSNLAVIGEQPGTVFPAVNQVGLADGSYYKFSYNQWGQVWKVTHYAADSVSANGQPNDAHPLSSTRLDLPGSELNAPSPQADCPRFKEERVWVEYGVRNQSGEVTTSYDEWAPNMASCKVTLPDGTTEQVSSYYTSADGWKKGLTASEVTTSGGQTVRTATLSWEHDGGAGAAYPTNPRVTQTTVSDPQQHTRTNRVTYTTTDDFAGALDIRLPKKVEECGETCSTVLRTTVTDYDVPNLGQYVARRILGLVRRRSIYGGTESDAKLRGRVEYLYDEPDGAQDTFLAALASPAAQHDGASYGPSMSWRGNANRVRRYSVNQTSGAVGDFVESRAAFNVTGTVAYAKDASGHQTSVSYADSFYQGVNRTHADPQYRLQTFAYPTTVTDPDGFRATTVYNYDLGVVTEVRTPTPSQTADLPGPLGRNYYDAAGRLVRSSSDDSGACTRVVYPAAMHLVESYTLVGAGKESRSTRVLDGAGRTRAASRYLPPLTDSGTGTYAGNYSAQMFDYDEMGRLVRQTDPAEVTASWAPAGEDTAWVYTSQTYDWKGRPLVTTHEADGSTFEYQYGGCGCAGGQTVSTRDEVGRRRRVTYDVAGRTETAQVFTQQATNVGFTISPTDSPYSTVTTAFDALGRVAEVRERDEATGAEQVTTTEYDGHGRVWRRRLPQYEANKFTTYAYHDDDTPASVTDPRGAVTAYTYDGNNRHLVTKVKHTLSGSDTLEVTYEYDAAGNRTKMDDGPGWVEYEYDVLSQLRKEKRHFDALSTNARNPYELNYAYTLSGRLETLTDPFDSQFTYGYDRAGQLREVKGSSYAGVTDYAWDVEYRAWGGVKSASFGDGASQTTSYDSRMRPSQYLLTGGSATPLREDFTYYADGRLRHITDLDDGTRLTSPRYQTMSRAYTYDHVGRVKEAGGHAPAEPGGNLGTPNWPSPYVQSYGYDGFGNLTSRSGTYGYRLSQTDTPTYVNNRRQGWDYDAGGRVTHSADPNGSTRTWTYDAAGRLVTTAETAAGVTRTLTQVYDGDGQVVYSSNGSTAGTDYEVHSSVLGGEVVTRLTSTGGKGYTYVPARGLVRARQVGSNYYGQPAVEWSHPDPVGVSESGPGGLAAYDPLGNYAGLPEPPPQTGPWPQPGGYYGPIWGGAGSSFSNVNNFSSGCMAPSGSPADCNRAMQQSMREHSGFWDNLPREYRGGEELWRGEQSYQNRVDQRFYGLTVVWGDRRIQIPGNRRRSPVSENPLRRYASSTKLSDEECDKKLSSIFGGHAKAMVTSDLRNPNGRGADGHTAASRNDLSATVPELDIETGKMKTVRRADRGGIIHTYTDPVGSSRTDTKLLAPAGWIGKPVPYYSGGNSGLIFNYAGGITIEFVHVGTHNKSKEPSGPLNVPNEDGLVEIGFVGGYGGDGKNYHHTHIVFFSNKAKNERIDPRVLFCGFPATPGK